MDSEKNIERFRKGFQLSKNFTIFLVCLSLAVLFWLLKLLSNSYSPIVEFPVKFVNFPKNKVAINYVPQTLAVRVEGYGYDLFTFDLFDDRDSIEIDGTYLEEKILGGKTYSYISTKSQLRKATANIDPDIQITDFLMDSIPFHFEERITKMVLVDLDLEINYEKQYAIKGDLKMRPQAVEISGPKSLLDTIHKLPTSKVVLSNVNNDVSITTRVITNDNRIVAKQQSVFVTVEVEKFTEAEIKVPIEFVNVPAGYTVRTFPNEISVVYLVGLSDYDQVTIDQFKAVADLSQLNTAPQKLKVKLEEFPSLITISKQNPKSVEYIIKK